MPSLIFDKIPLPNIKVYAAVSLLLLSGSIYFSIKSTNDPYWRMQGNSSESTLLIGKNDKFPNFEYKKKTAFDFQQSISEFHMPEHENIKIQPVRTVTTHLKDAASFMSQEPVCIWTLINMAYCCLILVGKMIQKIVFGDLRISEQQRLKDKFWNFIFYKFIFIFGVINVQYMNEVILWISWFSVLGFFHLLSQLSKDRFEYLSFSPTTPGWSHFRLVALLTTILTASLIMAIISIFFGLYNGLNIFAFMSAECFLLAIKTSHVLVRYGMFLYDLRQGGLISGALSWDKRGPYSYYTELIFDVAVLIVDFSHHLHMLIWSNIFLSMASLVIIMQLRCLANEIQRKYKKHRNYLWVQNHMEKSYPLASKIDLNQNSDNCAICWEKMDCARKLPCGHLFHNSCLQSWLEQDTSCPTCRLGLSTQNTLTERQGINRIDGNETNTRGNNHFFHFNGSRYVSWLPNFSVEVSNINSVLRQEPIPAAVQTSQIRNMARQVQEMFPNYPLSVIITDLQLSRSIELTIHNILEGRLSITPQPSGFVEENGFEFFFNNSAITSEHQEEDNITTSSNEYMTNTFDNGYEVERNSNIFGNQNDLLKDEGHDDVSLGDRFSKSSLEREKILQKRKEILMAMARKRYFEKNKSELNIPTSSTVVRHRNNNDMQDHNIKPHN